MNLSYKHFLKVRKQSKHVNLLKFYFKVRTIKLVFYVFFRLAVYPKFRSETFGALPRIKFYTIRRFRPTSVSERLVIQELKVARAGADMATGLTSVSAPGRLHVW